VRLIDRLLNKSFLSSDCKPAILCNVCFLFSAFLDYLENGGEVKFQEACSQITTEFSDCSKQVRIDLSQAKCVCHL
jgi:hypothetical protein